MKRGSLKFPSRKEQFWFGRSSQDSPAIRLRSSQSHTITGAGKRHAVPYRADLDRIYLTDGDHVHGARYR